MNDENQKRFPDTGQSASSPKETPSHLRLGSASSTMSHRQSITDQLRAPSSPRNQRHHSSSQAAAQDLVNRPPAANPSDPAFAGRDWKTIHVGELTDESDVDFVDLDANIEESTNRLVESKPAVVLIRESKDDAAVWGTFDFNDLNSYLLFVVGLTKPIGEQVRLVQEVSEKTRSGVKVSMKVVKELSGKEPFVTLSHLADLTKAVEIFGSGIHRIIIVKDGTDEVVGVLSQLRLVRFLWENGKSFAVIDKLYPQFLQGLSIGSHEVIAINGDRPLSEALMLLNVEGVSSLAVVDVYLNVLGNISTLLTTSSSLPLFDQTCLHFISVILSERGLMDGKDSVPVFYVNPHSTLAHTVAKLVATKAHRMWVVDSPSPGSSHPDTPLSTSATLVPQNSQPLHLPSSPTSPFISATSSGNATSGKLNGVVSLTDVLNLYARESGLSPLDPNETRRNRRRSSSSSVRGRMSFEAVRGSSMDIRR
ncbi:MAG: cell separation during budding [Vezdaea aestivalis]|nr:MAG: cell separation during budding [Vezdaea aestivalis]